MLRRVIGGALPRRLLGAPAARAKHTPVTMERTSLHAINKKLKVKQSDRPAPEGARVGDLPAHSFSPVPHAPCPSAPSHFSVLQPSGVYVRPHLGARTIVINRREMLNALDVRMLRKIRGALVQVRLAGCALVRVRLHADAGCATRCAWRSWRTIPGCRS